MSIAIIVIGFLGYLIFIKKQTGKAPAGFVQPIREFTEEEKIEILKTLSPPVNENLPSDESVPNKEKKEILNKLSAPVNQDLSFEEKMKILESLTQ